MNLTLGFPDLYPYQPWVEIDLCSPFFVWNSICCQYSTVITFMTYGAYEVALRIFSLLKKCVQHCYSVRNEIELQASYQRLY